MMCFLFSTICLVKLCVLSFLGVSEDKYLSTENVQMQNITKNQDQGDFFEFWTRKGPWRSVHEDWGFIVVDKYEFTVYARNASGTVLLGLLMRQFVGHKVISYVLKMTSRILFVVYHRNTWLQPSFIFDIDLSESGVFPGPVHSTTLDYSCMNGKSKLQQAFDEILSTSPSLQSPDVHSYSFSRSTLT